MTLTYKLDLDILPLDLYAKIQVPMKVRSPRKVRQMHTHRHTDNVKTITRDTSKGCNKDNLFRSHKVVFSDTKHCLLFQPDIPHWGQKLVCFQHSKISLTLDTFKWQTMYAPSRKVYWVGGTDCLYSNSTLATLILKSTFVIAKKLDTQHSYPLYGPSFRLKVLWAVTYTTAMQPYLFHFVLYKSMAPSWT